MLQGLVYLREELFVKGENGKGKATHLSLLCEKCSILALLLVTKYQVAGKVSYHLIMRKINCCPLAVCHGKLDSVIK